MKKLQSKIENSWVEIVTVTVTEEEVAILNSKDISDTETKLILGNKINTENRSLATETDAVLATSLYNSVKPSLEESDVYELIAIDLFIDTVKTTGILNYKINGEHKQISF